MNSTRNALFAIAASLVASPVAQAATSNVDVYGIFGVSVDLVSTPSSGVFSAAADISTNLFSETPFVPTVSATQLSAQTAAIALADYSAQAKTTLGNNHAYTQSNGFNNGAFGVNSFSGWYDQVSITGGTGTGTVQFSVQLNGVVTAGAHLGMAEYGLLTSTVHPTQLTSELTAFSVYNTQPWALFSNQVTDIARYDVLVSPYINPQEVLSIFDPQPPISSPVNGGGASGVPSIGDPSTTGGMGFPEYIPDLILAPGANQPVNVIMTGAITFTYGEAFYLIGGLKTLITNELDSFCTFETDASCTQHAQDGTGPTTLDFFNSAHLTTIVLPQGANFASASGAAYNVTAVPEPGEWLLMLAGLGLIGWRVRRRA
ncbi:MAG: PEP-CTERM sorting domain-containing protein [Thiobacillus sp.]